PRLSISAEDRGIAENKLARHRSAPGSSRGSQCCSNKSPGRFLGRAVFRLGEPAWLGQSLGHTYPLRQEYCRDSAAFALCQPDPRSPFEFSGRPRTPSPPVATCPVDRECSP